MLSWKKAGLAAVAALAAGAALAVVPAVHDRPGAERARPRHVSSTTSFADAAAGIPTPPAPAFTPGRAKLLNRHEQPSRFASVERVVDARSAPSAAAQSVGTLQPMTTDGTTNIVLVLSEKVSAEGLWARVRLAELPNNRTGWVPRTALGGYHFVHTHLVVDRARLDAVLLFDGRPIFRAPVGIGRAEAPTPGGSFYIRDKLSGFDNPFYGPIAYGTSARSDVLTDWPDGGVVGIHGTNEPELIPGRISHGCIRMRNDDILRLARLMPVGTPLTIT